MTVRARLLSRRGDFTLDVDLSVPGSGVTALFGPSGAGKTTLLRALAGLDRGVRGSLSVGGEVWQEGERALPPHRRALGYVFQEPSLFSHLTVRRNLEYGLRRVPAAERRVDLDRAVALLGLGSLLDRDPAGLSGGERQRVAIGRALVTSPRLLLLDEPLAALDRESKAGIFPLLEQLCEELAIPVLYVSHAADEVARLADHLALMERGRIRAVGPVAEMFTRLDLPLAYGDAAEAVITATVAGHDDAYHLTHLDFPGGRFAVPQVSLERGRRVRVRVLARDVSLTLERQTGTSILNIFPVRVAAVAAESPAQVMVRLDAGGTPVLARVTRRSAVDLGLEAGGLLHAQVKSVALLA